MITLTDCIALSDLTEAEIDAIAEHEHVPEMVAVEIGCCLVHAPDAARRISGMIRDDIAVARAHGRLAHVAELQEVLKGFVAGHPGL